MLSELSDHLSLNIFLLFLDIVTRICEDGGTQFSCVRGSRLILRLFVRLETFLGDVPTLLFFGKFIGILHAE